LAAATPIEAGSAPIARTEEKTMRGKTIGSAVALAVVLSGLGGFAWAQEAPRRQHMMGPQMMGPGHGMMQGMMGQGMGAQSKPEQGGPSTPARARTSEAGGVTVQATYRGPMGDGKIGVEVKLDTHSVPLDSYPIEKLALLKNDAGDTVSALGWENAQSSGHHRSGLLAFPAAASGRPLVSQETRSLELILKDLAGVPERILRWDLR
jgi:hypothetical protein